ncbi:MAG TPA: tetratricopeptide repeat protein, partial [Pirellulales bacterium]|nr:tetratricopeptide repeat protein [Pirellulales bacterium]
MIRRWLVRASLIVVSVSLLTLQAYGQRTSDKVAPGLVPGGSNADRNKPANQKSGAKPAKRVGTTKAVADSQETAKQPEAGTGAADAVADADSEEQRQRQIIERFLSVLEKNPRRGTALDRVYGHHVERGTLDQLVEGYRERTAKNAADGPAWMMLGLIDAQRGQDAAAVAAFQQAEQQMPKNYLASYYLGQSLVLVGQPDAAAEAFERAIERKPPPAEMLDVFQALGRVYQRAQRNEQALAVWTRLERLFPNDARVAEQIASTLAEEGQRDAALARYQKLAKLTKDRYRQSMFRMEAAELELRLGRTDQALADFESMLAELNPDSWLHREVRRRIEEAFLRNDDQAGLAKYYDAWLAKHADDVDAMARLAHTLAAQGRVPEAQKWLEQAIKLAPSRKELRLTFIEQLVYDQRYADAIAQYEALDKADPDNPDYLREWGQLVLKDTARPDAERRQAAAAVWRRMTEARPKDPLIATQVADLFRQAQMEDEAIELYRRAVELSPDAAQYREYLGEYYHQLKRSDEALATWRQIAAGDNRSSKNLARLAEVLSGFGYLEEAVETMGAACELEDDDFAMQLQYAELLAQDARYDDALARLDMAGKLAESAEETEAVLQQRIKSFDAADRLTAEIESLDKRLAAGQDATAEHWYLLARYREAAHQLPEATAAILKSLEIDEQSLPALAASAHIHEAAGSLQAAADAYRKLAAVDRRSRTTYLTEVAKLEARLGRREAALAAGRDLLAAAPGNPEHYEFFAELCFQLGEGDEGLETLRRSLRVNPSDPQVVLTLARALAERFRTDEAIELYWR